MLPALAFLANPAFWSGVGSAGSAAGGIGGLLGGLFGDEEVSQQDMRSDEQKQIDKLLANFLGTNLSKYNPGAAYGGQLSAPMTGMESDTLGILKKLLQAQPGGLFNQAKGVAGDTLSGKYLDVETSPLAKAMRASGALTLRDQLDALNAKRGASGDYFSSQTGAQHGRLAERLGAGLNTDIGNLLQQERQNQLNMIPYANQMSEYETTGLPLAQIGAGQQYGSLERLLNQADLERQYSEFGRQQSQLSAIPSLLGGAYSGNPQWGIKDWSQPNYMGTAIGQGVSSFFQPGGAFSKWMSGSGSTGGGEGGGNLEAILKSMGWNKYQTQ